MTPHRPPRPAPSDLDTLDDEAFLAAFERGTIPARAFRHRHHLRMAWLYLRGGDAGSAVERACTGVRRLAVAHGVPQKYHHTITRAWMEIVAHHVRRTPLVDTFDDLLATAPQLLDKQLLNRHYSSAVLASRPARSGWVEPDLLAIPA
jgi:hypothetical protein